MGDKTDTKLTKALPPNTYSRTLFIQRLEPEVSDVTALLDRFGEYGSVRSAVVLENAFHQPNGCALVEFTTQGAARQCLIDSAVKVAHDPQQPQVGWAVRVEDNKTLKKVCKRNRFPFATTKHSPPEAPAKSEVKDQETQTQTEDEGDAKPSEPKRVKTSYSAEKDISTEGAQGHTNAQSEIGEGKTNQCKIIIDKSTQLDIQRHTATIRLDAECSVADVIKIFEKQMPPGLLWMRPASLRLFLDFDCILNASEFVRAFGAFPFPATARCNLVLTHGTWQISPTTQIVSIRGVPKSISVTDLQSFLATEFGPVTAVKEGLSSLLGHTVEFASGDSARKCAEALRGSLMNGSIVTVLPKSIGGRDYERRSGRDDSFYEQDRRRDERHDDRRAGHRSRDRESHGEYQSRRHSSGYDERDFD